MTQNTQNLDKMDILTQGLIGATLAQAGARPHEVRLATLIGFCAPLLADAHSLIEKPGSENNIH
jgi:hypothetical protein